jgi:hypothetical protein
VLGRSQQQQQQQQLDRTGPLARLRPWRQMSLLLLTQRLVCPHQLTPVQEQRPRLQPQQQQMRRAAPWMRKL